MPFKFFVAAAMMLLGLTACGGGGLNSAPDNSGPVNPYDDPYDGSYDDYDYEYDCDGVAIEVSLMSVVRLKTGVADAPGVGEQAKFVFVFATTAIGGDARIPTRCLEGEVGAIAAHGSTYEVSNSESNVTSAVLSSDGDLLGEGSVIVQEGDIVVFTLTVTVTATADAFAQVSLLSIGWAPVYCPDEEWLYIDLEEFVADPIFLDYFEEKG